VFVRALCQRDHWKQDGNRVAGVLAARLLAARRSHALHRQGDLLLEPGQSLACKLTHVLDRALRCASFRQAQRPNVNRINETRIAVDVTVATIRYNI